MTKQQNETKIVAWFFANTALIKFEDFLSELDEGYNFDKMSIDEKIIALNTISANIDNLENELNTLELNFHEIELKLKN